MAGSVFQRTKYLTTGRHGGTFVAAPKLEQDLTTLAGFSGQLRRHGMVAGARSGEPLEYARGLFRGDRARVVVWTSELAGDI